MIYLIIGILGAFIFKKPIFELFEIALAHLLNAMDKAWNAIFN